jgi:hypothetical protein
MSRDVWELFRVSIARDYDPYNEILSAESDPMAAFLTYLADVTGGAVGNMHFTLEDFKAHIAGFAEAGIFWLPPGLGSKWGMSDVSRA